MNRLKNQSLDIIEVAIEAAISGGRGSENYRYL
jgi:hypothetical protein